MDDWDNDDFQPTVPGAAVPASWEDEEEDMALKKAKEDLKKEKEAPKEVKPKETKPKEEKKKEKEAPKKEMTAAEKKIHDQIIVETSDLGNTLSLFAGATIAPSNPEEFNILAKAIYDKVSAYESKKDFPVFVENLTRLLTTNMKPEDIKKISTSLAASATEKQKAKQVADSKKKVTKKTIVSLGGFDDDYTYQDDNQDDYDFM